MNTDFFETIRKLDKLNEDFFTEMALSRKDALVKVTELAPRFVEHFDKIYNDIDSESINHLTNELQAWLDYVLNIRLKNTNKPLSNQQKLDWFFTCGSDYETLFINETERQVYIDFVMLVSKNNDVKLSLQTLELM